MGHSRHFCCCIPVRAAVFITSLISFLGSGFGAGILFWLVHAIDTRPELFDENNVKITSGARTGLIITGAVLALIAVISLFGFIGSVIRNRGMVKAYVFLVWLCFFFSLGLTGFTFYLVFSNSTLIQCLDQNSNEVPCSSLFNTGRKVGIVVSTVISLLFQLYVCVVIRRYVDQLEDEQAYKNDFGLNKKNTSYYPFQSVESRNGLLDGKN